MIPYYAITLYAAVMGILSTALSRRFIADRNKEISRGADLKPLRPTKWTYFDFLLVIGLIIFSALRFQVGSDFAMYTRLYESQYVDDWALQIQASPQEIGYTVLSLFLFRVSQAPELLFWVTSIITVLPAYAAIKKRSDDPTMSVLLYIMLAFFVTPFNIIRQGIAISLNFWANTFIEKNKVAFVIINAIAATFHTSVLIVAVVQLLVHKWKFTKKKTVVALIAAVIAAGGLSTFTSLATWLNGLNGRYDAYIGNTATSAGLGTYLVLFVTLALLAYAATFGNVQDNSKYFTYVLIGVAFLIVGTQAIAVARMQLYFGIFLVLLVPNQMHKRPERSLEKLFLAAAAAVYFGFHLANYGDLTPYQTYLGTPH